MRLAGVQFIPCLRFPSSNAAFQSIRIRHRARMCNRQYSQSIPPVPPPLHTDTTSKSSGLNHQLHPSGRPPLSPKPRMTSTTIETSANIDSNSTIEENQPAAVIGGFRTPLRVQSSNTPVSIRDTVKVVYEGPLRKTVRGLKAFSISSLILSTGMTPFILTMEANLPMIARISMLTAGSPSKTLFPSSLNLKLIVCLQR